jgi:glycosyltransferase involved in cell wall biosynthesis
LTVSAYLWIIDLSYASRQHHGGVLRYLNFSRELVAQGHTVTFAVHYEDQPAKCVEWLDSLKAEGVLSDHCEFAVDTSLPGWNRLATLLAPFNLQRRAIRPLVERTHAAMKSALQRFPSDTVIVSSRRTIFIADTTLAPCIGDFSDSETLRLWRELTYDIGRGLYRSAASRLPNLSAYFFQELYIPRRYARNILVSPVDKRVFDALGSPERNVCLANGVRIGAISKDLVKNPYQIIFSGVMDFAPNYEGAIWFLDHVFPIVLQKLPQATFVVAGTRPVPALAARAGASVRITGFVEDLNAAIAQSSLYIAPLVTGCGFKNKVVEAISNGTYVIGTRFAAEFLDPEIAGLVTVRDDPGEMAEAICDYFANPAPYAEKLKRLREILREQFSWEAKAAELARIADSTL